MMVAATSAGSRQFRSGLLDELVIQPPYRLAITVWSSPALRHVDNPSRSFALSRIGCPSHHCSVDPGAWDHLPLVLPAGKEVACQELRAQRLRHALKLSAVSSLEGIYCFRETKE